MDPDTCLRDYYAAVERMRGPGASVSKSELYEEADELWHNLRNWIRMGGFKPQAWDDADWNEAWFWGKPHVKEEP